MTGPLCEVLPDEPKTAKPSMMVAGYRKPRPHTGGQEGRHTMNATNNEGYRGWTNHETWTVNLWLMNDESSYGLLCDVLKRKTDNQEAADLLRDLIEDDTNDMMKAKEITSSMAGDLLTHALAQVNWLEIIQDNRS